MKGGPFEIPRRRAARLLADPNPDGRSNARRRPAVGQRPGHHAADRATCGSSTSASTCRARGRALRGALRVRPARTSARCAIQIARHACRRRWWLHDEARPEMRRALARLDRYIATPLSHEAPALRLAGRGHAPGSPTRRHRASMTTTRSAFSTRASTRLWALGTGDPARKTSRLPLHAHDLLRDLPVPGPHARTARESRGGRPPPRRAPRRLAQPARPRPRRPREAHPHQPLQPAPHLARQRPRRPRRRRLRRLRLAG